LSHLEKYSVFFKVKISFSKSIDKGIKIINYETWNEYCIENGKAEVSVDLSEKFTPHELNYHKTNIVNFEKGCFTGQEVIARMHYRGKLKFALARFEIESNELLKPSQIILDSSGKKVGQIIIYSNKMGLISLKNTSNLKNIFFLEEGKEVAFKSLDVI
jgi:folate-binding protein YgfZ